MGNKNIINSSGNSQVFNKKSLSFLILILLLLTLLEAYLNNKDRQLTQHINNQKTISTNIDVNKSSSTSLPLNWKTYNNKQIGYNIKYPDGWNVTREEEQPSFKSLVQISQDNFKTLPNFIILVTKDNYSNLINHAMKNIQMTKSIAAKREDKIMGDGNSDYLVNIIFQNREYVFQIQAYFSNPPSKEEFEEFNKILSTFELTY